MAKPRFEIFRGETTEHHSEMEEGELDNQLSDEGSLRAVPTQGPGSHG